MRDHWTDDRMDDLARRMDQGFDRVDTDLRTLRQEVRDQGKELRSEMAGMTGALRAETAVMGRELRAETADLGKSLRGEMNARFDKLEVRFDSMQRLLIQVAGGLIAAFLAGLLGLIATQL